MRRRIRGCGAAFPRVLGHYGRLLGLFPLETAIYKMTGLTAKNFGLKDRGVLARRRLSPTSRCSTPNTVDSAATYEKPIAPARGIDTRHRQRRRGLAAAASRPVPHPGRVLSRETLPAGA